MVDWDLRQKRTHFSLVLQCCPFRGGRMSEATNVQLIRQLYDTMSTGDLTLRLR